MRTTKDLTFCLQMQIQVRSQEQLKLGATTDPCNVDKLKVSELKNEFDDSGLHTKGLKEHSVSHSGKDVHLHLSKVANSVLTLRYMHSHLYDFFIHDLNIHFNNVFFHHVVLSLVCIRYLSYALGCP